MIDWKISMKYLSAQMITGERHTKRREAKEYFIIVTKISFEIMQFMISSLDKGRYSIVSNLQML